MRSSEQPHGGTWLSVSSHFSFTEIKPLTFLHSEWPKLNEICPIQGATWLLLRPIRRKPAVLYMQSKKAQFSLWICAVWPVPPLSAWSIWDSEEGTLLLSIIFNRCPGWSISSLIGKRSDRFSDDEAKLHILHYFLPNNDKGELIHQTEELSFDIHRKESLPI